MLITTHYMDEADHLCDRIAIVDHGKLVALDTPMALKASVPGTNVVEAQFTHESDEWPERLKTVGRRDLRWKRTARACTGCSLPTARSRRRSWWRWRCSRGEAIKSLSVQNTTLDDVFVHYTGRQLRDEQVKAVGFMMPPRPGMQP